MKIGTKLYKYQGMGRLAEYIVTANIKREDSIQYELECQNCNHGEKCRVIVEHDKVNPYYNFVECLSSEYWHQDEYKCWHTSDQEHEKYYMNKESVLLVLHRYEIKLLQEEIQKKQKELDKLNRKLNELYSKNPLMPE